jgi:hypothetical protein
MALALRGVTWTWVTVSAVSVGRAARTGRNAIVSFSWVFQGHRLVNVVGMRVLSAGVLCAERIRPPRMMPVSPVES